MGSNAGEMPNARPISALITKKKMYQIANICISKILMLQYCWAVSLAWPCSAMHCSSSREEEGSALYTSSLPRCGVVPELEMGSVSALPPLPSGLLPLFSETNRESWNSWSISADFQEFAGVTVTESVRKCSIECIVILSRNIKGQV